MSWNEENGAYLARCPEFPGLSAFGETPEEAVAGLETAVELAVATYQEEGWDLPQPVS